VTSVSDTAYLPRKLPILGHGQEGRHGLGGRSQTGSDLVGRLPRRLAFPLGAPISRTTIRLFTLYGPQWGQTKGKAIRKRKRKKKKPRQGREAVEGGKKIRGHKTRKT
jgi:hypothetical protein